MAFQVFLLIFSVNRHTLCIVLQLFETLLAATNRFSYHLHTDKFYKNCVLARELIKLDLCVTSIVMDIGKGLPLVAKKMRLCLHEVRLLCLHEVRL